ncbi:testis-specific serine/threonine-protein kinase 3-like [Clytia hemisphaerica]|uniref:testis-specific serine/threonine-protein kinase 3-like n=1 Tax=Clytia hemisphaerica TaxID=252671 RepID=UPI0034D46A27
MDNLAPANVVVDCESRGYTLEEVLGQGSYGTVYQASSKRFDRPVAIKMIDPKKAGEGYMEYYLPNEYKSLLAVKGSQYVVQILDVFRGSTGIVYFVMECVEDGDLYDYLENEALPENEAQDIFKQICLGIKHCFDRNIVHRDLKPDNILLAEDGTCKLTDFGFARNVEDGKLLWDRCGTKEYMAPEIIKGEARYDGKASDLWSLGIILYELVTGQRPFDSEENDKLFLKEQQLGPAWPPSMSIACKNLITSLLNQDPKRRPSIEMVLKSPWLFETSLPTAKNKHQEDVSSSHRSEIVPSDVSDEVVNQQSKKSAKPITKTGHKHKLESFIEEDKYKECRLKIKRQKLSDKIGTKRLYIDAFTWQKINQQICCMNQIKYHFINETSSECNSHYSMASQTNIASSNCNNHNVITSQTNIHRLNIARYGRERRDNLKREANFGGSYF